MPKTSTEQLRELEDELDALEAQLSAADSFIQIAGDVFVRSAEIRAIHVVLPKASPPSETQSGESSPPESKPKSKKQPTESTTFSSKGCVHVWALGEWLRVSERHWTGVIALLGEEQVANISTEDVLIEEGK
jgi:hypothetical protein